MSDKIPSLPRRCARQLVRAWTALTAGDRVIAVLAVVVFAYFCATPGIFQGKASGDGLLGFFYLPGLVFHHSLDMAGPGGTFWISRLGLEQTKHLANPCPIGTVPLWLPTYLLGLGVKKLVMLFVTLPAAEASSKVYPMGGFDYWMAGLGSLISGLCGVALGFRLIARKLGVGAARFAMVTTVLATPLAWYFANQPLYQHACAFFVVTLLVERWDAWRGAMTLGRWALLGVIGGAAMLMRVQEAVWLLVPGLDAAYLVLANVRHDRRAARDALLGGVVLVAVTVIVFSPQLLIWKYFFGTFRTPQPPGHMRWLDPGLLAMLFSMRGGLIAWSPILYFFIPGLLLSRKELDGLAWRMGLLFLIVWWVNASAWDHWASWTFGARRFTDSSVIFAVGLGGFWRWASRVTWRRRFLLGVTVFLILWNGLLMELVRQRKVKSSGAFAYPASTWIGWAHGPGWLGRILDRTGYPFVQPVGWIYALIYRAPVTTFEGVVGNYLLERDCHNHDVVLMNQLKFVDDLVFVVEGIAHAPEGGWPASQVLVPVTGTRARVLIPLAGKEPVRVKLLGQFNARESEVRVSWNGRALKTTTARASKPGAFDEVRFEVPIEIVHTRARTNELVMEGLPAGAKVARLDFESFTRWYDHP